MVTYKPKKGCPPTPLKRKNGPFIILVSRPVRPAPPSGRPSRPMIYAILWITTGADSSAARRDARDAACLIHRRSGGIFGRRILAGMPYKEALGRLRSSRNIEFIDEGYALPSCSNESRIPVSEEMQSSPVDDRPRGIYICRAGARGDRACAVSSGIIPYIAGPRMSCARARTHNLHGLYRLLTSCWMHDFRKPEERVLWVQVQPRAMPWRYRHGTRILRRGLPRGCDRLCIIQI